jgi:hypothetical protein
VYSLQADSFELNAEDINADLHIQVPPSKPNLLGLFSAQSVEYALFRCGILTYLQRIGYGDFVVEIQPTETGDHLRVFGHSAQRRHLLIEAVIARRWIDGSEYLFINWLTLRNPTASFGPKRPQLPGQEVPGLGLAREAAELFAGLADKAGLRGVVFRPAWFHLAVVASEQFRFLSPERQGRFEALIRDLSNVPLRDASQAIANGRVRLNGKPYAWEADDMGFASQALPSDARRISDEKSRSHFQLDEVEQAPVHT